MLEDDVWWISVHNFKSMSGMRQTVDSYVCLEGQSYETVFDPVGLVVSRVEGVASLPTLAALPHSPLVGVLHTKKSEKVVGKTAQIFGTSTMIQISSNNSESCYIRLLKMTLVQRCKSNVPGRCRGDLWPVLGRRRDLWPVLGRYRGDLWPVLGRCCDLWPVLGRCRGDLWAVLGRYCELRPFGMAVTCELYSAAIVGIYELCSADIVSCDRLVWRWPVTCTRQASWWPVRCSAPCSGHCSRWGPDRQWRLAPCPAHRSWSASSAPETNWWRTSRRSDRCTPLRRPCPETRLPPTSGAKCSEKCSTSEENVPFDACLKNMIKTVYVSNRDSENSDWKTATAKQRLTIATVSSATAKTASHTLERLMKTATGSTATMKNSDCPNIGRFLSGAVNSFSPLADLLRFVGFTWADMMLLNVFLNRF